MQISKFGQKFTRPSGITQLMKDLGQAFSENHPELCMLGGGNPALIPEAQSLFAQIMQEMIDSGSYAEMLGYYDGPQGNLKFRQLLAEYLSKQNGWSIGPNNIALTNGSQNSFFKGGKTHKKLCFLLVQFACRGDA